MDQKDSTSTMKLDPDNNLASCSEQCPAVEVEDVWLTFGSGEDKAGLKGASITVARGTIYALLGPSGCGKTTLMTTVVGLRPVQKGRVRVFGTQPGSKTSGVPGPWIGFMPQETCLLTELTVEETLSFFARLNCVPEAKLKDKIDHFKNILDLPSERLARQMSGGQIRRLSLAVAMIHDPPLLILDEPTVGVDPMLRKTIWNCLEHLVKEESKTVVMTTHYIEEARLANMSGLMRDGTILLEENPTSLMSRYGVSNMESVFLKLCFDHEKLQKNRHLRDKPDVNCESTLTVRDQESESIYELDTRHNSTEQLVKNEKISLDPLSGSDELESKNIDDTSLVDKELQLSPSRLHLKHSNLQGLPKTSRSSRDTLLIVYGLTWKSTMLLRRNLVFLLLTFVSPMTNFLMIRMNFGHLPVGLPIILVNSGHETISKHFLTEHLGKSSLQVIHHDNLQEAIQIVKSGKANAVINIPEDFSRNMLKRLSLGLKADNATVLKSRLNLFLDNSNLVMGSTVYVSVLQSFLGILRDFRELFGARVVDASIPLKICKPVFGKPDIELTHAIMLAEVPESLFVMNMAIAAMVFVRDRENGILQRLRVCGLGPFEIMFSHLVLQSALLLLQLSSLLGLLAGLGIEVRGSYVVLSLLLALASYVGMSVGMLLSVLTSKVHTAMLLVVLLQFLTIGLSGVFWPLEGIDRTTVIFSFFHPMTTMIRSVKLVINNGLGLWNFNVGCAVPHALFYILLGTGLTAFIYNGNKQEIVDSLLAFKKPNIAFFRTKPDNVLFESANEKGDSRKFRA